MPPAGTDCQTRGAYRGCHCCHISEASVGHQERVCVWGPHTGGPARASHGGGEPVSKTEADRRCDGKEGQGTPSRPTTDGHCHPGEMRDRPHSRSWGRLEVRALTPTLCTAPPPPLARKQCHVRVQPAALDTCVRTDAGRPCVPQPLGQPPRAGPGAPDTERCDLVGRPSGTLGVTKALKMTLAVSSRGGGGPYDCNHFW